MPLRMRLGLVSLGFSGAGISSDAMPFPIPIFLVIEGTGSSAGAQAKACGYHIFSLCCYFNLSPDVLAENFPFRSPH
jgi:hypothetical protein